MDDRRKSLALSWLWALTPLWTLGFATGGIMVHAALKKKSILQGATIPIYLAGIIFVLAFDPDHGGRQEFLFGLGMTANMGLGLMHAIGIRGWVFSDELRRRTGLRDRQAQAMADLREQREARAAARALVAERPEEARRLAIGRPDIPNRSYPDGGVVDVNQVSAHVLATHLSMPSARAQRIIEMRERVGGFSSYEDLLLVTDIEPGVLDPMAEFMVFTCV